MYAFGQIINFVDPEIEIKIRIRVIFESDALLLESLRNIIRKIDTLGEFADIGQKVV